MCVWLTLQVFKFENKSFKKKFEVFHNHLKTTFELLLKCILNIYLFNQKSLNKNDSFFLNIYFFFSPNMPLIMFLMKELKLNLYNTL